MESQSCLNVDYMQVNVWSSLELIGKVATFSKTLWRHNRACTHNPGKSPFGILLKGKWFVIRAVISGTIYFCCSVHSTRRYLQNIEIRKRKREKGVEAFYRYGLFYVRSERLTSKSNVDKNSQTRVEFLFFSVPKNTSGLWWHDL